MQDLAHVMTDDNLFIWDFDPKKGDLKTVDGMETALLVSLFTDARLDESQVPPPLARGGWVGNIRTAKEPRDLGGKLWALENARLTTYTLAQRKEQCTRCMDWLLKDGLIRNAAAVSSYNNDTIADNIQITARDGAKYEAVYLWRKTNAFTHAAN